MLQERIATLRIGYSIPPLQSASMNYEEIKQLKQDFEEVPGTYLFNADRCREGYHLNMFCMSLQKAENREAFLADEEKYLDRFPMTAAQRQAVRDRDWIGMVRLGANIYYMSKFGATLGRSFQYMAGEMTGQGQEAYRKMMVSGGRVVAGNRHISENKGKVVHKANG